MNKKETKKTAFAIRYIYITVNKNGKKKNRFGSTVIEMDATPAQLIRSKKLHIYLGQQAKVPNGHTAISVQITDITEYKENETKPKEQDNNQTEVNRSSENESGEIREAEKEKPKDRESKKSF